ncbi:MAG: OsmC family protein [Candidatus Omnitrophica bacterium]|nr:OsmC family protein [Candidatus Omnitrophota bacterium]
MYHVDITNTAGYVFEIKSKDYVFTVDIKGKGITPPDTLLASLGSCIGVYVRKYAESAKLEIKEVKISVDAEFTKEVPLRFQVINAGIDLCGAKLDERRQAALLEFIKNCPVHNTLAAHPEVNIKIG